MGAIVALALVTCGGGEPDPRPPNVLLVTFDTLRADHLGCYGYPRDTSPNIDAFARTATRYTRAMASSPWTVPTHASLFTGKNPFEHGAHGYRVELPVDNVSPLDGAQLTLAEALASEGYRTAAFVANAGFLGPRWQLDQGFEIYRARRLYAPALNDAVFGWLAQVDERPFFLFVNYIDTHRPYNATHRPGFDEALATDAGGKLVEQLRDQVLGGGGPIPAGLADRVIEQYDTAIANVDDQFGRLLAALERAGLADQTLIVATSDHGEYFGEHRLVEHSKDVYQPAIWVPLLIRAPGQHSGRIVDDLISSTDVAGLIFSEFPGAVAARQADRFPDLPGNHPVLAELYYTRPGDLLHPVWGHRFDRVRTAIYDGPYKYIHSSDGDHELFDLRADGAESTNLLAAQPAVAERLADELREFLASRERAPTKPASGSLSPEEADALKALGYIDE